MKRIEPKKLAVIAIKIRHREPYLPFLEGIFNTPGRMTRLCRSMCRLNQR